MYAFTACSKALEHFRLNRITVAISIALLSACASQPRQATAPPGPVAPAAELAASSPAPPTAAAAAAAATSPHGAPATSNLTPDPALLKQGYKVQTYHGQLMYCHTEELTGSALTRKVCLSAEQIRARTENAREIMDTRRSDASCGQLACN
jgi:hypothetical protein